MLYSYKGNYPKQLPDRIRLSDRSTRTDKSTFTDGQILDAGYVAVDNKPAYNASVEKVEWNTTSITWDTISLNEQEVTLNIAQQWVGIREERDGLLQSMDHIVQVALESGEPISEELRTYRQALRDIPQTHDSPNNITWPELPDD